MQLSRIFQHIIIAGYLAVTFLALCYTLTANRPPREKPLTFFAYGMMAPFQGYVIFSQDLLVEGRTTTGNWETINYAAYMPFLRGERIMRAWLLPHRGLGRNRDLLEHYQKFAYRIQELEEEKGRRYSAVRLHWQRWPVSPAGYEYLKEDTFIEKSFIVQIP